MLKYFIFFFVTLFLLANFCWEGKPLWKHVVPAVENVVDDVKDESGKTLENAKDSLKKGIDETRKSIKEGAEKIKESVKDEPKADISDEDKEKLNDIIKKNTKKEKK